MKKRIRIAQSAPIDIEVSRKLKYAGTERIVDALNQTYHELGHDSIVSASGDSDLSGYGKLVATCPKSLWAISSNGLERKMVRSQEAYENHYKKCLEFAISQGVDVIHDHPGQFLVNSVAYLEQRERLRIPIITTIHEDTSKDKEKKYSVWRQLQSEGRPIWFIAISESQRRIYEKETRIDIPNFVYNGIPLEDFSFKKEKKDYLFWIGRLSDIKGTDLAVRTALIAKRPLIIAGEIHSPYKNFYEEKVLPYINRTVPGDSYEDQERNRNSLIEMLNEGEDIVGHQEILFIGPVNNQQKSVLYRNAYATLVPNRWNEPFGLISIESMATGTPVIGTYMGALPEVIKHGFSGFLVNPTWINLDQRVLDEETVIRDLVFSVDQISRLNPQNCRIHVQNNFTRQKMAQSYIRLYEDILSSKL